MKKEFFPELLAPAGDFEKLEIALEYGADAVYAAGKNFSLRQFSKNFDDEQLLKAIDFVHKKKKKIFITVNSYPRNQDIDKIEQFLKKFNGKPDAFIISDPGIVFMAKDVASNTKIHISTQANTTNYNTIKFWESFGNVNRVNLARELTKDEIITIREKTDMELEIFTHGAVCMSYSGRCFLSMYLNGRDANRGECTQPCRWEYFISEKKRDEEVFSIKQDSKGTYFFNSKDLSLLEHIPDILKIGINSLKLEGRTKNINYLATVVSVYREAIDSWLENPDKWQLKKEWIEELGRISHRNYSTGFFPGKQEEALTEINHSYNRKYHFAALSLEKERYADYWKIKIFPKNTVYKGEKVVYLSPNHKKDELIVEEILDINGNNVEKSHPGKTFYWIVKNEILPNTIFRIENLK